MTQQTDSKLHQAPMSNVWRLYAFLAIVQGVAALLLILKTPSTNEGGIFLGLSTFRLLVVGTLFFTSLAFAWFLVKSWRSPNWYQTTVDRISVWLARSRVWGAVAIISLLGLFGGIYFVTLTPEISETFTQAIFIRLQPLALWLSGLSAQTLAALAIARYGFDREAAAAKGKYLALYLLILGLFLLVWAWVVDTQYAVESQVLGWNVPGVPILETQVLLAWLASLGMLAFVYLKNQSPEEQRRLKWLTPRTIDLILAVSLWLGAVILWNSIAITPSWFVSEPREPNFEYYPNSDAFAYDATSQVLMAGEGLQFVGYRYIRRPMHAIFLTLLHLVAGQDYESLVFLQILVLATLPVFIYFLTKALGNRVSAVIAAVLILLREANSIAIAGTITASHAKSLMADLPATLAVVCFVYALIIWLQDVDHKPLYPFVVGGLLGIAVLIRPELGVLLAVTILVLFLLLRKTPFQFFKVSALLIMGLALIISPWVWRNWKLTGLIFLDTPGFRLDSILRRYEQSGDVDAPGMDDATDGISVAPTDTPSTPKVQPFELAVPVTPDYTQPAASLDLTSPFPQNAPSAFAFIPAHYMNSQLQTILILPATLRGFDSLVGFVGHREPDRLWYECCSLAGYARRLPFWRKWDGVIPSQTLLPLAINLFIILLGVFHAMEKHRLIGITPLLLGASHLLFNSIFRNSGGRYILPVDWISIMYYSIGLAQATIWGISLFTNSPVAEDFPQTQGVPEKAAAASRPLLHSPGFYILAITIFLTGCVLPVAENSFKPLYTAAATNQMLETLLQSEHLSEMDRANLQTFLSQDGVVLSGRGLYPRYYAPGESEPGRKKLKAKPYPRLSFYLAGPHSELLVMPVQGRPSNFPNAADTLTIGCPGEEFDALAVAVYDISGTLQAIFARSPFPTTFTCPLPPIDEQIGDSS